ncbi:hypothetical protein [Haladaptatus sp. R4]|uniref:hypothetical protein n=1 Tax=Haladaptatus sp. R4 TaxID=1679489 RepID=UPI0021012A16|nr:hypothetical protein [Haladaptatus sp. R4]
MSDRRAFGDDEVAGLGVHVPVDGALDTDVSGERRHVAVDGSGSGDEDVTRKRVEITVDVPRITTVPAVAERPPLTVWPCPTTTVPPVRVCSAAAVAGAMARRSTRTMIGTSLRRVTSAHMVQGVDFRENSN